MVNSLGAPIEKASATISSLAADELLVKVSYASINPLDEKLRLYNHQKRPYPLAVGFDYSGVVVAVGDDSTKSFSVGDKVFGAKVAGGAYGEYLKVSKDIAVAKRGSIPAKEAAAYDTFQKLKAENRHESAAVNIEHE